MTAEPDDIVHVVFSPSKQAYLDMSGYFVKLRSAKQYLYAEDAQKRCEAHNRVTEEAHSVGLGATWPADVVVKTFRLCEATTIDHRA